jgi:hypothetical protein
MTVPRLEDFLHRADLWLAARYPRADGASAGRFTWGEGSDEVRVFQEPDPAQEAAALPAIRRWRQELWDHGYGWIAGRPNTAAAACPPPTRAPSGS